MWCGFSGGLSAIRAPANGSEPLASSLADPADGAGAGQAATGDHRPEGERGSRSYCRIPFASKKAWVLYSSTGSFSKVPSTFTYSTKDWA